MPRKKKTSNVLVNRNVIPPEQVSEAVEVLRRFLMDGKRMLWDGDHFTSVGFLEPVLEALIHTTFSRLLSTIDPNQAYWHQQGGTGGYRYMFSYERSEDTYGSKKNIRNIIGKNE